MKHRPPPNTRALTHHHTHTNAAPISDPFQAPPLGEGEALLSTVKFSMEAPTEPMEDGINLGDESRQTFPLKLEVPLSSSLPKGSKGSGNDTESTAPHSPVSAQTEEGTTGVTDLARLDLSHVGLDSDDPLAVLSQDLSGLCPDDLSTGSGDPTGGVDDPFDEEDYCGWLAEEI